MRRLLVCWLAAGSLGAQVSYDRLRNGRPLVQSDDRI